MGAGAAHMTPETIPPPSSRPTTPPSDADREAVDTYEREVRELGEQQARLRFLSKIAGVR